MSIQIELPVARKLQRAVAGMDRLRDEWGAASLPEDRLSRLAAAARVRAITASCRLSGIRLSERDVGRVLRDPASTVPDAAAVRGYAAAMDSPPPEGQRLLTSDYLKRLNALAVGAAGSLETAEPSPLRETPSHCEAFDGEGRAMGRVIPILPPRLIPDKLEDLLTWYELERRSHESRPVPVIGTFVLGLMAISPFDRANGRTIRALTGHLLFRAGYGYLPYVSVEREMESLRETYYEAFDRSQAGLWAGTAEVDSWLDYCAEVLERHRRRAELRLRLECGTADLSPLQRAILDTVREHGTVDAGLLLKATGANRNTLKDNLRRMVDRGMLEKTGQRRTTKYRLAGTPAEAVAVNDRG